MAISAVSGVSDYAALYGAGTKTKSADFASKIMEKLDTDADSKVSLEESKLQENIFSQIDINGDGTVSQDEIAENLEKASSMLQSLASQSSMTAFNIQNMSGDDMAASMLSAYDADNSKSLSLEEAQQSQLNPELFTKMDSDADANLSAKELSDVFNKIISKSSGTESGSSSSSTDESSLKFTAEDIDALMAQMSMASANKSMYNNTMDMFLKQNEKAS